MITSLLLAALVAVESGGNANAIGDSGQAVGVLQIHAAVVNDVNRFAGTNYTQADAKDPEVAQWMCRTYLEHYVTADRLGHTPTSEDFARCWNGGPNGWRKPATLGYWARVRRHMNQ